MSKLYDKYTRLLAERRLDFFSFISSSLIWLVLTLLHFLLEPHSTTTLHMMMDFLVLQAGVWLLATGLVRAMDRTNDESLHPRRKGDRLAVLQERERFGRDLHDGVIQSIYAVGLMIEDCQQRVESEPELVQARLGQIMTNLNGVIMDIRSYILDLYPSSGRSETLGVQLADLIEEMFGEIELKPRLETDSFAPGLLSSAQEMEILRVTQEALLNAQRHALATAIVVRLHMVQGVVHLQIEDNGVGFLPDAVVISGGLHNMQERARLLEGQLTIDSGEGMGTCVHLSFAP